MTTNTTSAEQRLIDLYNREPQTSNSEWPGVPPSSPLPPPPLTAQERLANTYKSTQPKKELSGAPARLPPLTAEQRLARAYETEKPASAQQNAERPDDAVDGGVEASAENETAGRIRAPEGYHLDAETGRTLSSVATELQLSDDTMQKLVDRMSPALAEQTNRKLQSLMDDWVDETTNDPEIGGARLNESITLAQRALTDLGTPELRKLLGPPGEGGAGLGNHKEIIRLLAKVGRRMAADRASNNVPRRPLRSPTDRLADSYRGPR